MLVPLCLFFPLPEFRLRRWFGDRVGVFAELFNS